MPKSPEQKWQAITEAQLAKREVTSGTGFGRSEGLRVSGKVFAMLMKKELVVKLPKERVDSLTTSGVGHNLQSGRGRVIKEWVAISPKAARQWRALVEEARVFVGPTLTLRLPGPQIECGGKS